MLSEKWFHNYVLRQGTNVRMRIGPCPTKSIMYIYPTDAKPNKQATEAYIKKPARLFNWQIS